MARRAMNSLEKTWKVSGITLNTKNKIVQTLIFSIFLYRTESWIIKPQDRQKADAFEMHWWRIPWTARRMCEECMKKPRRLPEIVNTKVLQYFDHVTRRDIDYVERLVVYDKMERTRPKSRFPRK